MAVPRSRTTCPAGARVGSVTPMPSPGDVHDDAGEAILHAVRDQTHVLLGTTIGFSEHDWAQPSRLPGWTRSHVAAHLVQNARTLLARAHALLTDAPAPPAPPEDEQAHALELGALADGLSLQIALDTTAGGLDEVMTRVPAGSDIPMVRLFEVVMHTFDLSPGSDELGVAPSVARELLAFWLDRADPETLPRAHVVSHEGLEVHLGAPAEAAARVTGPSADLLMWLARDVVTDRIGGATLPPPAAD